MEIIPAYYSCPRCNGRNHYFALRTVGQAGFSVGYDDLPMSPGMLRGVEKEVALCKDCGERMNYTKKVEILTEEEDKQLTKKVNKGLLWFLVILAGVTFLGVEIIRS